METFKCNHCGADSPKETAHKGEYYIEARTGHRVSWGVYFRRNPKDDNDIYCEPCVKANFNGNFESVADNLLSKAIKKAKYGHIVVLLPTS